MPQIPASYPAATPFSYDELVLLTSHGDPPTASSHASTSGGDHSVALTLSGGDDVKRVTERKTKFTQRDPRHGLTQRLTIPGTPDDIPNTTPTLTATQLTQPPNNDPIWKHVWAYMEEKELALLYKHHAFLYCPCPNHSLTTITSELDATHNHGATSRNDTQSELDMSPHYMLNDSDPGGDTSNDSDTSPNTFYKAYIVYPGMYCFVLAVHEQYSEFLKT
jgi:hypothetical protein